ncbi:MAG: hypothetical protein ACRDUA_25440, partial [Micromonosporaceae bacterium]
MTRRVMTSRGGRIAVLAALTVLIGGCAVATGDEPDKGGVTDRGTRSRPPGDEAPPPGPQTRLLGDGSTAFTGAQPNQPVPARLEPGEIPPQFVVFSWDGAGED